MELIPTQIYVPLHTIGGLCFLWWNIQTQLHCLYNGLSCYESSNFLRERRRILAVMYHINTIDLRPSSCLIVFTVISCNMHACTYVLGRKLLCSEGGGGEKGGGCGMGSARNNCSFTADVFV